MGKSVNSILFTILSISKTIGIHGSLLLAVCTQETGLKNIFIENDRGTPTIGICGIKKATANTVGFDGTERELMDIKINIWYAAKYLKYQIKRYDGDYCKAVAAYNAGSYIESQKKPGFPKNLKYVRKVQEKLERDLQSKLSCDLKDSRFIDKLE